MSSAIQILLTQTDIQLPFSARLYVLLLNISLSPSRWLHVPNTSYLHIRLIYGPADCRTTELENPVELKETTVFNCNCIIWSYSYKVYMIKISNKKFYVTTKTTLVLVTKYNSLFGWNLTSCISQHCYPVNFFLGVISSYDFPVPTLFIYI